MTRENCARSVALVCVAASLTASCVRQPRTALPVEFLGYYLPGFERDVYLPCDSVESRSPWVLFVPDHLLARRDSLFGLAGAGPYVARVRGVLSAPGAYGHLGMARRLLRATDILSIAPATLSASCTVPVSMRMRYRLPE